MMTSTIDHPHLFCAWPRRAFAVCQAALLGALLVLAGCGAGPLITVELSGDNLDQGRLEMALELDGHAAAQTEVLQPGQRRFTVRLPAHATGKLLIQVQRFVDGDVCAVDEGFGEADVPGDPLVKVPLEKRYFRPCPAPADPVNRVFGFGASDVWFALDNGKLRHWDGKAITEIDAGMGACLRGLWGPSADRLWVVGCDGFIARREGGTLKTYSAAGVTSELTSVHGVSESLAWAVGLNGAMLRWDNNRWNKVDSGVTTNLWGVFATSATDVWAVGDGVILHSSDGMKWTSALSMTDVNFISLWASGPNDIWVGDDDGLLHHSTNGQTFTTVDPKVDGGAIFDLWGNGKGQLWGAVKGGRVLYLEPQNPWKVAPVPGYDKANFSSIWASSTNDLWVVGGYSDGPEGLILHLLPHP